MGAPWAGDLDLDEISLSYFLVSVCEMENLILINLSHILLKCEKCM